MATDTPQQSSSRDGLTKPAEVALFLTIDVEKSDFNETLRKDQLRIKLEAIAGQLQKIAEEVSR